MHNPIFGFPQVQDFSLHEGELFVSVEKLLSFFISEVHRRVMTTGEESERTTEGRESWRLKDVGEIIDFCVAVP